MNLFDPVLLRRFLAAGLGDPAAWIVLGFVALAVSLFVLLVRRTARSASKDMAARAAVSHLTHAFLRAFCCEPWRAAGLIDAEAFAEHVAADPAMRPFAPPGTPRTSKRENSGEVSCPAGPASSDIDLPGPNHDDNNKTKDQVSNRSLVVDPESLRRAIRAMRPHCTMRHFDHALVERLSPSVDFFSHVGARKSDAYATMARVTFSQHSPLREIVLAAYPGDDGESDRSNGSPPVDWTANGCVVAFRLWSEDDVDPHGMEAQVSKVRKSVRKSKAPSATDDESDDDDDDDDGINNNNNNNNEFHEKREERAITNAARNASAARRRNNRNR